MPSERVQRQTDRLLDEAEQAMAAGTSWGSEIVDGIRNCAAMLVCCTAVAMGMVPASEKARRLESRLRR